MKTEPQTVEHAGAVESLGAGSASDEAMRRLSASDSAQSRQLSWDKSELQHAFRHAPDFGVFGRESKLSLKAFGQRLHRHVMSPETRMIPGLFHGESVTHFLDVSTGLNVIRDADGFLWSAWRLSEAQLHHVLESGCLGGSK